MAAYLIANYDITNEEGFSAYVQLVPPTMLAHGGEILVAGPGSKLIEGSPRANSVVAKFPSMEALQTWYGSPEYQSIIKQRTDNTEGNLVFADEFVIPG